MKQNSILIVGSFYHPRNKLHYTSAAEQLAELLIKNEIPVITTTSQFGKVARLVSTVYAILKNKTKFKIAVLSLYGTPMNFIWHETASGLLRLLHKKIIVVVHGGSIPDQITRGEKKFFKALKRSDRIICPSGFIADFLNDYGYEVAVIENVLDIRSYPFLRKNIFRPHILWMRSFNEIYNPQMAVRTASLLAKKYPSFKMVMAGSDHGLMNEIKKMIADYGLSKQIELPGYINQEQKIRYAQECDIYINTNRIDNAPVTVVENMALGLAIVSVNIGGIPYILKDGVNALLVEPDSHMQMAGAIETIINNPQSAMQRCDNARNNAYRFDEKCVLEKWKLLFKEFDD